MGWKCSVQPQIRMMTNCIVIGLVPYWVTGRTIAKKQVRRDLKD